MHLPCRRGARPTHHHGRVGVFRSTRLLRNQSENAGLESVSRKGAVLGMCYACLLVRAPRVRLPGEPAMYDSTRGFVALMGRLFLSQIFLFSGVMKVVGWSKTASAMQEHGMPAVPFFLAAAIAVELGAGLMILLGWKT